MTAKSNSSRLANVRASFLCILAALHASANAAGDPARGKESYAQRCGACHSIEYNATGPAHGGLFGRKAGTVPNFAYSAALKASSVTWSEESLDKWLTDPDKLIPGQKMWVSVSDADERQNIIAYLKAATRRGS